jgi:ribosome biogenesis protein NSA2
MRKLLKAHDQRNVKAAPSNANEHKEALPSYLLDREDQNQAKVLSSALKQRRKDKAGKFAVPLPKVRGIAEDEAFRVVKTGKTRRKGWKRMVTKVGTSAY